MKKTFPTLVSASMRDRQARGKNAYKKHEDDLTDEGEADDDEDLEEMEELEEEEEEEDEYVSISSCFDLLLAGLGVFVTDLFWGDLGMMMMTLTMLAKRLLRPFSAVNRKLLRRVSVGLMLLRCWIGLNS